MSNQRMGSWGRRELLLLGASLLTVIAGAAGSFRLLGVAESRSRAAILVGQVQVHTPALVNAIFGPLNGRPDASSAQVAISEQAQIVAELKELGEIGVLSRDVASLNTAAETLFAAISSVNGKAAVGDFSGANELAKTVMVDAQSAMTAQNGVVLDKIGEASSNATLQAKVGILSLLIGTVITVTGLLFLGRRRRRERDASAARFESLVRSSSDIIVVSTQKGELTYASPSLIQTLGEPIDGRSFSQRIQIDDRLVVEAAMAALQVTPDQSVHLEFRVMHRDGRWLTIESTVTNKLADRELAGFLWNARDISERKLLEGQLLRQALEDPLTGLPNRIVLRDRLANALARAARRSVAVGVLLIDLDCFKEVNDQAGHDAGDAVLVEVATRLSRFLRGGDTVARLGGDEFAMVVDDVTDETVVDEIAGRILAVLEEPIIVNDRQYRITSSVGRVLCVGDYDADEALRYADIAMYAAKAAGKGRMMAFHPVMADQLDRRLAMVSDLVGAARSGQLVLVYQPTVDLKSGEISGVEALVRWNHPSRGLIGPGEFIPLAEETGAILSIGRWVLSRACHDAARWQNDATMAAVQSVSVNLSGRQLLDDNIVADVRDAMSVSGLDPGRLTLEITETVLMSDKDAVVTQLFALKALGVSLAVDDFGTGYSSLSYLRNFPIDILKIDKAFVDEVAHSGAALATAIVNMGTSLNMKTIAEGIEVEEQAAVLKQLGCDIGQGFLYSRPVPIQEFEYIVKTNATSASTTD